MTEQKNSSRLIDTQLAGVTREKDMKVLCLGLSRTSTFSLWIALRMLGFNAYHCAQTREEPPGTYRIWNDGIRAKYYGEGDRYGKAELDKILGKFDAITDIPYVIFSKELLDAYPDAKVVLTVRDEDSWVKSVKKVFDTLTGWNWGIVGWADKPMILDYAAMLWVIWNVWTGGDHNDAKLRQTFRDHYAYVRSRVPKDKLLEFHGSQGWEPLCRHLGIEKIPDRPYPNKNDAAMTIEFFVGFWWETAAKATREAAQKILIPTSVLIGGRLWYYWSL